MSDAGWNTIGLILLAIVNGVGGYFMFKLKLASEIATSKVETAAVSAGVAVNRVNAVARQVAIGQQERTEKLDGLATEVAEVKQLGKETHILVDGQMSDARLTIVLTARLLAIADPSAKNLADLALAERKYTEQLARMKSVDASAAAGDPLVTGPLKGPPK